MSTKRQLTKADYEALARFRYALRRYLRLSEEQAVAAGVTPQQHLAMLAIRGYPCRDYATVGELAERLQIKHHSAVELVNRLETAGMVTRRPANHDKRLVQVFLTPRGDEILEGLSSTLEPPRTELVHELERELNQLNRS